MIDTTLIPPANTFDEASYLRKQIAEAQKKLDTLSLDKQREWNLAQQRREFTASENAVNDARTRYKAIQELAVTHLVELYKTIENAHQYRTYTDIGGKVVREHVMPGNPIIDPEKKPGLDAVAQRLTQTLISEYQHRVRLEHAEQRFAELASTAYAAVAPATSGNVAEVSTVTEPEPVADESLTTAEVERLISTRLPGPDAEPTSGKAFVS